MESENEKDGDRVDLEPDKLISSFEKSGVDALKRAPVQFAGLLGDDDDSDYIRIYQDYELRTFVVVNRKDVIHRQRTINAAGVEVSIVFVDKDAVVEIREVASEKVQADALSQALRAAEGGVPSGAASEALAPTITLTPPVSAAICTKIFCTNITCGCTSRHSTLCSITCTNHPICPNPWTKNWFCAANR